VSTQRIIGLGAAQMLAACARVLRAPAAARLRGNVHAAELLLVISQHLGAHVLA